MDYTAKFYSRPSYVGSGVVFSGERRQRGGSILGALKSVVMPVLSKVGPKILKTVGNIAKKQVFGLATDLLTDRVSGRNVTESLKSRGKSRLLQSAAQGLNAISSMVNQPNSRRAAPKKTKRRNWRGRGSGISKRKSVTKQKSASRKQKSTSRKRKGSRKRATPAKKRRVNF